MKNEKSNHKHTYAPCLFSYDYVNLYWETYLGYAKGEYCTICGKTRNIKLSEVDENHVRLTHSEVYNKYKHLPIIHIDGTFINLNAR